MDCPNCGALLEAIGNAKYCRECGRLERDGHVTNPEPLNAVTRSGPHVRRIVEGPFWAVLLPDGTLLGHLNTNANGAFLYNAPPSKYPEGRVVRVRSVTYEVEE